MDSDKLPHDILPGLAWSFIGGQYDDVAQFADEVSDSLAEIGAASWAPEALVLAAPRLMVSYRNDSESGQGLIDLRCEDGKAFTARELLFQIHNAIVDEVEDLDHHFFEGLRLKSLPVVDAPPVYALRLGS